MRGRKPKPVETQISEGDPAKRGVGKLKEKLSAAPKAESGYLARNKRLTGIAAETWDFWSEQLAIMKLDKRPDGPTLEGACWNFDRAINAEMILQREGLLIKELYVEPDSKQIIVLRVKKHPAVEIANRAWLIVKAFCSEFGLTPVSRTRLTLPDAGKSSEDEELMKALSAPRVPRIPTTAVH